MRGIWVRGRNQFSGIKQVCTWDVFKCMAKHVLNIYDYICCVEDGKSPITLCRKSQSA